MEQRRCIWEVVTELGSGKGHPLRQHGTEKVYLGGCDEFGSGKGHPLRQHGTEKVYLGGCDKSSHLGKDTHLGSMEQRRCIWEVVTRVRIWERTPT